MYVIVKRFWSCKHEKHTSCQSPSGVCNWNTELNCMHLEVIQPPRMANGWAFYVIGNFSFVDPLSSTVNIVVKVPSLVFQKIILLLFVQWFMIPLSMAFYFQKRRLIMLSFFSCMKSISDTSLGIDFALPQTFGNVASDRLLTSGLIHGT